MECGYGSVVNSFACCCCQCKDMCVSWYDASEFTKTKVIETKSLSPTLTRNSRMKALKDVSDQDPKKYSPLLYAVCFVNHKGNQVTLKRF